MALIGFFDDASAPPMGLSTNAGTYNLGIEFTALRAGLSVAGLQFWKIATDTGSHTGSLYRVSDTSLLGSVVFTGETATGWQSATFTTPVSLTNGAVYRATVSHAGTTFVQSVSFSGTSVAGVMSCSSTGVYIAAATGYPSNVLGAVWWGVDLIVNDGTTASARRYRLSAQTV